MIKSINNLKILVMGLPGAGKTTLAEKLSKRLSPARFPKFHFPVLASTW